MRLTIVGKIDLNKISGLGDGSSDVWTVGGMPLITLMPVGKKVKVRYAFAQEPRTIEEIDINMLKVLDGQMDGRLSEVWSDVTGFLWMEEDLKIGGHNLIDVIRRHQNKYLAMEVIFDPEEESDLFLYFEDGNFKVTVHGYDLT